MRRTTTFETILEVKKGAYITKKDAKEGQYPVILGGREPAYYIDRFNHTGKAIVISRSGASAGYVSRWDEPIFITDGFLIEPKNDVDYDFVYYALKNCEGILQGRQSGAAIPHVTPRLINNIEVVVPSLDEQKKITNILSSYDSFIENCQCQIKLLEEAAFRLFKEWFIDLRFPGHDKVVIVDGVPTGWEKKKIIELTSVLRRGISPIYNGEGKYTVINQKCIRSSIMSRDEARRQEKEYPYEINLQDADTVICSTGTGTLGRVGQVCGDYPETTIDSHVTLVRAKRYANLLYHSIKANQEYLMGMGRGSTNQQELYRNVIEETEVLWPSLDIAARFEEIAQSIHRKITVLDRMVASSIEARDRLLPKLMSDEIEL